MNLREIVGTILTPADKVFIGILLLLSLSSYAVTGLFFPHHDEMIALVEVKGTEVMRLSLDPRLAARERTLAIEGGHAVLHVSEGKIRLMPMDDKLCPEQICSKTGWIDKPWQMILCLPNRISVRIVGAQKEGDIDVMTR